MACGADGALKLGYVIRIHPSWSPNRWSFT